MLSQPQRPRQTAAPSSSGPAPEHTHVPRWLHNGGAWGWRLLVIGLCVYGLAQLAVRMRVAVLPVILGLILAALLEPVVRLLERIRVPTPLAGLLAILLGLSTVAGTVALVVATGAREQSDVSAAVSEGYGQLVHWVSETVGVSSDTVQAWVDEHLERLRSSASSAAGSIVAGLADLVTTLSVAALTGVFGWFFLWNGPSHFQALTDFLPARHGAHLQELGGRMWRTVGAYMRGMVIIAVADALLLGLGLLLIGMPMILPLMLLLFVGAFVPYVGSIVSGVVTALVALAHGGLPQAGLAVAVSFAVQQIEGNLLAPFIMARAVKLTPAFVLFAVTAGGALAGVLGVFLAVPLTACALATLLYAREQGAL